MYGDTRNEALRQLDGLAADVFRWLRAVHAATWVGGAAAGIPPLSVPAALEHWCEAAGSETEVAARRAAVAELRRRTRTLQALAADLLDYGGAPPPGAYDRLLAETGALAAAVRRLDAALRQEAAETDPLTGIHNRQGMLRDLTREWTRAARTNSPCAVAVLDLDHFKRINDTYGHVAGDKVLCAAAHFLRRRLRPYDLLYRFGGEEFLLCLPNADSAQARHVLERIRRLMARLPVRVDHTRALAMTCSIGIALMRRDESPAETVARADWAMYAAKAGGRNQVRIDPADAGAAAALGPPSADATLLRRPG